MKAFKSILVIILLLQIAVFTSCEKDLVNSSQFLYTSYYELKTGKFVDYNVMEINHDEDALVQHDTLIYQMRCKLEDTTIDNSGRVVYKYVRYKRLSDSDPWVQHDLWTTILDNNKAELVEENQRIVKLVFPVSTFAEWNANQFNMDSKMTCSYKNIHKSRSINTLSFDSTLTVEQENKRNLIEFKRKYEVYANHVGMIRKYYKDLAIDNFDTLNIKSGKEIFMEITNFGE